MMKRFLSLFLIVTAPQANAQHLPFDAREATVASIHEGLFNGEYSCRDVVTAFLARIEAFNHEINAIITLNGHALELADGLDYRIGVGNTTGSLLCVPILLKDNFDTHDMRTTGGCLTLQDSQPMKDSATVAALREAGAIILGKTNMHEMALEGLSVSSLGGQTMNPYDFSRTPGGSSGGSAAAVAASFAVFATGTDTVNSLRNPASANSLFSIRPTRGLISRSGVIPVSYTQDAVGVIARSIHDVATAITVMANVGADNFDNTTAHVPLSHRNWNYAFHMRPADLGRLRLGLVTTFFDRTYSEETIPVNVVTDQFVDRLRRVGVTVVPITTPVFKSTRILNELDTQRFEYREVLNEYLSSPTLGGQRPSSFDELYAVEDSPYDKRFLVIPAQYEYIKTARVSSTSNKTYAAVQAGISNLTDTLHGIIKSNQLDALIYPQQQNLVVKIGASSQIGRNGILAALTGSPVITIPAGFSNATASAPIGVPIGLEILGLPWTEQELLNIARSIEVHVPIRKPPDWASRVVAPQRMTMVPVIRPDSTNISPSYPLGTYR